MANASQKKDSKDYFDEERYLDEISSPGDSQSGEENEDDVSEEEESLNSSEEDDDDEEEADQGQEESKRCAELRQMMSEQQKAVVATVSQSAAADAEKGRAVKQQRSTFDALLNTRIRLQKGLVATNSLAAVEGRDTVRAAEEAALRLWNMLDGLRQDLSTIKTGDKRKREYDISTPSSNLWESMQAHESISVPQRRATLEKWSSKVRGATTLPLARRLNNTAVQQTITDVLAEQLSNPERLIKRTQVPRSCAPIQASKGIHETPEIFDDADFYQLLLKELVDQRMVDNTTSTASLQNGAVQWQAAREAKTKKHVDTKASKARKLRYTVHEKLQNFMAPEDRGSWDTRQTDELFGSLLGRKMELGEDVPIESDNEDLGEAGLMLFRG